ncbi:delta-60 repeat domain-containing protein [Pseudomonas frederiksbergensis]|uniref:delta-60 repeat domain-containing protein n=1 Tax=Pseudomonas frederiksbergensis TaxID=104087 RepID=UPI000F4935C6|nr:delta-60 repeat domain-containing protein [Pseudomonas frederiksbergensis]RON43143.1 hypothetical protein BK667_30340 [Pseudomonas frederiksbergensis]
MTSSMSLPSHPGQLDLSFGNNGRLRLPSIELRFTPVNMALTEKKDLLIYGHVWKPQFRFLFAVLRLKLNGDIDKSFGENGFATGFFGIDELLHRSTSFAEDMIELPGGKILLSGYYQPEDGNSRFCGFVRLNADGSLDKTFGTDGKVLIAPRSTTATRKKEQQPPDSPNAENVSNANVNVNMRMCVLSDGRIIKLMTFDHDGVFTQEVVCLTRDGVIDPLFGNAGYAKIVFPYSNMAYNKVVAVEDGKFAICGTADVPHTIFDRSVVLKLTDEGVLDLKFAEEGVLELPRTKDIEYLLPNMCVQPNGRLLLCGSSNVDPKESSGLLISIESNGTPNIQFNKGKPFIAEVDGDLSGWASAIVVQPQARILLIGAAGGESTLTRLSNEGVPDTDFAQGKPTFRFSGEDFGFMGAAVIHDKRIYLLSGFELLRAVIP